MSALIAGLVRDRQFARTSIKQLLMRLAWAADDDGSNIAVSIEALADDCGLVPATVRRTLRETERLGVLRLQELERGPWRPRIYAIDVPFLVEAFPLTRAGERRLRDRQLRGAA